MTEKIFKVSEIIDYVNRELSGAVVVEGEISRIDVRQGNLIFVTIADKDSSIDVFGLVFRIRNINELEEGMLVRVYGSPGLYKKSGRFRIDAERIIPAGEGSLRIAFEKLKQKLENEGIFDISRKRMLVRFPEKVALVTAPKSQAYNDFVKILSERFGGIQVDFYPSQVQGLGAVTQLTTALGRASLSKIKYDAVVLVRGGGSLEDLQAFNSEEVVREIFSSKYPVICGVGHEGDVSLSDLVADVRASTPTNAAELVAPDREAVSAEINGNMGIISREMDQKVNEAKSNIHQSLSVVLRAVERKRDLIQALSLSILQTLQMREKDIDVMKGRIQESRQRIIMNQNTVVQNIQESLVTNQRLIKSYDVKKTLKRGYSITRKKNGMIIRDANEVAERDDIEITLYKGTIKTRIKK
ncbi:exodeoxyribonuclease VII large subunit [Patescibacteria group bacterium]